MPILRLRTLFRFGAKSWSPFCGEGLPGLSIAIRFSPFAIRCSRGYHPFPLFLLLCPKSPYLIPRYLAHPAPHTRSAIRFSLFAIHISFLVNGSGSILFLCSFSFIPSPHTSYPITSYPISSYPAPHTRSAIRFSLFAFRSSLIVGAASFSFVPSPLSQVPIPHTPLPHTPRTPYLIPHYLIPHYPIPIYYRFLLPKI